MRQGVSVPREQASVMESEESRGKRRWMLARVRIRFYRRGTQCMNPVSVCYINCAACALCSHVEEQESARDGQGRVCDLPYNHLVLRSIHSILVGRDGKTARLEKVGQTMRAIFDELRQ
jgi:hypothetical protein